MDSHGESTGSHINTRRDPVMKGPVLVKKVAIVGDSKVGKTALFSRFIKNAFSEAYSETIGVNIGKKQIRVTEAGNTEVKLILWDLFGDHLKGEVRRLALNNVDAVIIASDISNPSTMYSASEFWTRSVLELHIPVNLFYAFTKSDLEPDYVDKAARKFRERLQMLHKDFVYPPVFATSSKLNMGVDEMFSEIARICLTREKPKFNESVPTQDPVLVKDSYESVFEKIVFDLVENFSEKLDTEELISNSYRKSNLDKDGFLPEDLEKFISELETGMSDLRISPRQIIRFTGSWKTLKHNAGMSKSNSS